MGCPQHPFLLVTTSFWDNFLSSFLIWRACPEGKESYSFPVKTCGLFSGRRWDKATQMEASSTSLKRLKFGKLKVVRRRLLQRYEHQPFISCLAGFYSCRWKRYQRRRTEPGKCCCKTVNSCKISTDIDFCVGTGQSKLTSVWCHGPETSLPNDIWSPLRTVGCLIYWCVSVESSVFLSHHGVNECVVAGKDLAPDSPGQWNISKPD